MNDELLRLIDSVTDKKIRDKILKAAKKILSNEKAKKKPAHRPNMHDLTRAEALSALIYGGSLSEADRLSGLSHGSIGYRIKAMYGKEWKATVKEIKEASPNFKEEISYSELKELFRQAEQLKRDAISNNTGGIIKFDFKNKKVEFVKEKEK